MKKYLLLINKNLILYVVLFTAFGFLNITWKGIIADSNVLLFSFGFLIAMAFFGIIANGRIGYYKIYKQKLVIGFLLIESMEWNSKSGAVVESNCLCLYQDIENKSIFIKIRLELIKNNPVKGKEFLNDIINNINDNNGLIDETVYKISSDIMSIDNYLYIDNKKLSGSLKLLFLYVLLEVITFYTPLQLFVQTFSQSEISTVTIYTSIISFSFSVIFVIYSIFLLIQISKKKKKSIRLTMVFIVTRLIKISCIKIMDIINTYYVNRVDIIYEIASSITIVISAWIMVLIFKEYLTSSDNVKKTLVN